MIKATVVSPDIYQGMIMKTMMMGFNRMLKVSVVFVSFVLTGCLIPMGDSYIFVEGNIKTNKNIPSNNCKLKIYTVNNHTLLQEKEIGLAIKTSLIINPYYKGDYYIKIQCGDYFYVTEGFEIQGTKYYDSPLILGDILLTKQKEYASEAEVSPEKAIKINDSGK